MEHSALELIINLSFLGLNNPSDCSPLQLKNNEGSRTESRYSERIHKLSFRPPYSDRQYLTHTVASNTNGKLNLCVNYMTGQE